MILFVVFGKTLWILYIGHLQPRGIDNWIFNTNNFVLNFVKFKCLLAKTLRALYSGMQCHVVW